VGGFVRTFVYYRALDGVHDRDISAEEL